MLRINTRDQTADGLSGKALPVFFRSILDLDLDLKCSQILDTLCTETALVCVWVIHWKSPCEALKREGFWYAGGPQVSGVQSTAATIS